VKSEYVANYTTNAFTANGNARGINEGTVFFQSAYLTTTYFLTGEHRIYDYQKGIVGRVVPYENAFAFRNRLGGSIFGRGAWQAKARLNRIDLNDKDIHGGRLLGTTYGLNWFLNPNMKVQFDFDVTSRNSPGNQGPIAGSLSNIYGNQTAFDTHGLIYGFGTRFAADF
jgi:phosphate-selective porin OprO and OprP